MVNRLEKFIEKANKVHNNKYDYSKVKYINSQTKVCIICPEHGEFWQEPAAHVRGYNCPKCSNIKRGDTFRSTREKFIEKAEHIHNNKYDYSKVKYINSQTKVCVICPEHGEFLILPQNHLLGQGCPKCVGKHLSTEEIIDKFKSIHGSEYDYSKVKYGKMHEKVCIICPEHGEFWQTPSKHMNGQGCPKCAIKKRSKSKIISTNEFKERSNIIHKGKYTYDKTVYNGTYDYVTITCPKHGDFSQRANDHLNGHGCPHCGNNISKMEDEICEFLNEFGIMYERNNRTILNGNEIDILITEKNIGIECDGLRWHSEEFKLNDYHVNKTDMCFKKGVCLIHIFEDEWINKKDIIKDKILSLVGMLPNKIFARKCEINVPSEKEKRDFLNINHIQGDVTDSVKLGLYYQGSMVAVMTFGRPRLSLGHKNVNDGEYELLRYCTLLNTNVIGGASKLFKYFVKNYGPKKIISYCDRRFSVGNMYEKIGFSFDHISKPNYYYISGNNRINRFRFRKTELIKDGFDSNKTEHEIMLDRGSIVYSYIYKKE